MCTVELLFMTFVGCMKQNDKYIDAATLKWEGNYYANVGDNYRLYMYRECATHIDMR